MLPLFKFSFAVLLVLGTFSSGFKAQKRDSVQSIEEVVLDHYQKPVSFLSSGKSFGVIQGDLLKENSSQRMVESMNLISGTQMEERSPGSYRLSVRGSTLRSPFGVRNVKIYLDDLILTDPSGGTYLNLIDPRALKSMVVFKGPETGDFGANTGGTVLLQTAERNEVNLSVGSFGEVSSSLELNDKLGKHKLSGFIGQSRSDGYRDQSSFSRQSLLLKDEISYALESSLNILFLASSMDYETPGGLTFSQKDENPRASRPATRATPGAREQEAGIKNKTLFLGVSNRAPLSNKLSHFALVQGSYTDLRNPFITNYEERFENSFQIRSYLSYKNASPHALWETKLGVEGGRGSTLVKNYDNEKGAPKDPQNFDQLTASSGFVYLSQQYSWKEKLFLEGALSLNFLRYDVEALYTTAFKLNRSLDPALLPNFSVVYLPGKDFSIRAKLSKGSSSPTLEELRSSNQELNLNLNPESGLNKEIGLRKKLGKSIYLEASYFHFPLHSAIVRSLDEEGREYFSNSGKIKQSGVEFSFELLPQKLNSSFIDNVSLLLSGSLYDFKYENYQKDGMDYSGNRVPGTPPVSLQGQLRFKLLNLLEVESAHYYRSSFFLNDSATVETSPSLIGNILVSVPLPMDSYPLRLYGRLQNLYNERYSLGYDLNAFGDRFYNPSATRNFSVGLEMNF